MSGRSRSQATPSSWRSSNGGSALYTPAERIFLEAVQLAPPCDDFTATSSFRFARPRADGGDTGALLELFVDGGGERQRSSRVRVGENLAGRNPTTDRTRYTTAPS